MDINALITLFFGVAVLAAKPGPGVMTVATKAMGEGLLSVIYLMIGTNLVKIMFFALVVMGYGFLPEHMVFLSIVLKSITALYLIWLGVQGLQKPDPNARPNDRIVAKQGFLQNFTAGFMLTVANPFDILFFAGILPTIMKLNAVSTSDFIFCAITIVLADTLVAMSYAVPIALTRNFLKPGFVRKLNIVSSIGLILVGLYIGYSAFPSVN